MSKSKSITIKTGNTFSGHGYGEKIKPVVQPTPKKTYDPKKGNTGFSG